MKFNDGVSIGAILVKRILQFLNYVLPLIIDYF